MLRPGWLMQAAREAKETPAVAIRQGLDTGVPRQLMRQAIETARQLSDARAKLILKIVEMLPMDHIERPLRLNELLLTWQSPTERRRNIVGRVRLNGDGSAVFEYTTGQDEFVAARRLGFECYPAFPDLEKTYTSGVLESFESRLARKTRSDYSE